MSTTRPVSGRQVQITHAGSVVKVGQVAAVLREFSVNGVAFTETWEDSLVAPMGCGMVLAPWPNRVASGRWTHNGKALQLDITEPSRGNAIHGLLRNTAYEISAVQHDSVTLSASIYPQHGYPFILDVDVTYSLGDDGLTVRHQITNAGDQPAPFGVGAHPYLRVGAHSIDDLVVTLSGRTHVVVDEKMIPIGAEPVDGTLLDLRAGRRLGDLSVDVCITDFDFTDGRVEHRLDAPDGTSLVLWAEEVFGWAQVYSPTEFPGPGLPGQRRAVAIEPMTCGVNALATGIDLLTVQPGETWSGSWGLRPEGF